MHKLFSVAAAVWALVAPAHAQAPFTVGLRPIADQKAVFATVESPNAVPARTRIGGTLASLSVRQGDPVNQGQVIAVVGATSCCCRSVRSMRRLPVCSRRRRRHRWTSSERRRCFARVRVRSSR